MSYAEFVKANIATMTADECTDDLARLREIARKGIGAANEEFESIVALLEARLKELSK